MPLLNLEPDELETVREALMHYAKTFRHVSAPWEVGNPRQDAHIARIDAALAALARPPVQWTPVDTYINQEIITFTAGGSQVINTNIQGRVITLYDDSGRGMATVLRPDYAVCRLSPAAEPVQGWTPVEDGKYCNESPDGSDDWCIKLTDNGDSIWQGNGYDGIWTEIGSLSFWGFRLCRLSPAAEPVQEWTPVDYDLLQRGLALMLEANGLEEYADCRVCRLSPAAPRGQGGTP